MIDDGVKVVLDRERTVRLSMEALCTYEAETGENVLKLAWGDMSMTQLSILLWAGLREDDPALTLHDVRRMITRRNMVPTMQALAQAWQLAAPEDEGESGGDANPTSTGEASGPSAGTTSA